MISISKAISDQNLRATIHTFRIQANEMHKLQDPSLQLTRLELEIMQVLWSLGHGNVRVVQGKLEKSRAYNTVQTVLNILERKGKVKRSLKGRAYEYMPTLTSENALSSAVKDVIDRMFGGSAEKLIIALVQNRILSAERVGELGEKMRQR